jgi:hypothetical protein
MKEPKITVNGVTLTPAQAMAVRVAVTHFIHAMQEKDALGTDQIGRDIANGYAERGSEVLAVMLSR